MSSQLRLKGLRDQAERCLGPPPQTLSSCGLSESSGLESASPGLQSAHRATPVASPAMARRDSSRCRRPPREGSRTTTFGLREPAFVHRKQAEFTFSRTGLVWLSFSGQPEVVA